MPSKKVPHQVPFLLGLEGHEVHATLPNARLRLYFVQNNNSDRILFQAKTESEIFYLQ